MLRHRSLVRLILAIFCVVPALAGPGDNSGVRHAGPGAGPPIHNRIHDLLDEELFLSSDETASWTSAPFHTSRFNRVILKTASEVESGFLSCYLEWQFAEDDEFEAFAATGTVIGDDVNPRILVPAGSNPSLVYGMRARVRCDLRGSDFGSSEPPPPATGSLTDVKVLLRRE